MRHCKINAKRGSSRTGFWAEGTEIQSSLRSASKMKSFFQKLILDVVRGGSLADRLGDELEWSESEDKEILEFRQLMLPTDPITERLETDFFMDASTENIPLVNKVFEPPSFFVHQGKACRVFLFSAEYATEQGKNDCLELLARFPDPFQERFDISLVSNFQDTGQYKVEYRDPYESERSSHRPQHNRKVCERLVRLDTLQEHFQRLHRFAPKLFSINNYGLQVQFEDTLNLEQGRQLCLLTVEVADRIASAKAAGRLSVRLT